MAIEALALDLHQRAAERAENDDSKKVLIQIAEEERTHLELLGRLFEP
jgi:rubrerythrin